MTDRIHPLAASGFDRAADAYERGRPDYPGDAVAAIAGRLDLRPGRTVLDLGAGTGKLTRLLGPSGARVIALEPVAGMRRALEAAVPGVEVLDGTAEAIPLPAVSIDGAVAAQAFHWFDTVRALSELHRVIRPGGHVALVWNLRDETVPWVKALGDLMEAAAGGEAPRYQRGWRDRIDRCALFDRLATTTFRHVQRLTVEGVVDRVASVSSVAAAEAPIRETLLADVRALMASDPETAGRDVIELPYTTRLSMGARRTIPAGVEGIVASVNRNDGGVPKPPVDDARIGRLGLESDGHHNPDVHGGERGAVCLYAQEAIERVREDGHQAFPGAYGENLTLLGIELAGLAEGDRLALGEADDGPLLQLTQPATPCETQAHWFTGARIGRISHRAHPADARWYARVLREGSVAPGTPVRVLPRP